MRIKTIGNVTLINGDSLDILARPDFVGRIDAVITDPPYEDHMHDAKSGKKTRKLRTDGGKESKALDFESINATRHIITPLMLDRCDGWALIFCTPEGVAPWRDEIEAAGARYKRATFWDKTDGMPQMNGQGPATPGEMVVTAWCGKGVSKWNGGGRRGIWRHPCNPPDRDGRHPTEKPVSLMAELITHFTNPGDLILDPYAGSGSTLIAAAATGRRAIGIERSEQWFDVACERLSRDMFLAAGITGTRAVDKNPAHEKFMLDGQASSA